MKNLGIYVHIPFCKRKCLYCDFNSYDNKNELTDSYIKALIDEISAFCADGFVADTVFFGGGTPTVLSFEQLDEIMSSLKSKFIFDKNAEISIETNPGTTDSFLPLKEIGFNRISIGMQSANDDELKMLGRIHTNAEFLKSYEKAIQYFDNINIDAMLALPNQTLDKWKNTLNQLKTLAPKHISAYSLKVEENTPFADMPLNLPCEDADRQMYYYTRSFLEDLGYNSYEISNFSKPGYECRHNKKYWTRLPYIGFGAGAHSNIGNKRFMNIYGLDEYISAENKRLDETVLTDADAMNEFVFLGLRLKNGISSDEFKNIFGKTLEQLFDAPLKKHIKLKTIKYEKNRYSLTDYGIDVSNNVLSDFLL